MDTNNKNPLQKKFQDKFYSEVVTPHNKVRRKIKGQFTSFNKAYYVQEMKSALV